MQIVTDSFYNTYNARHLNPREVAERFIYSASFEKLVQNNHSIILGARGCGKTTLMKMLTLPALQSWQGDEAPHIRTSMPFYAVYISTDIYWDVKNNTYGSQLAPFGSFSERLSHFSVNTNVFKALCETFRDIINIHLEDRDENKEIQLCRAMIKAWKLPLTIPKIEYVISALNNRVDDVNQLVHEVIYNANGPDDVPNEEFFNLSFESSIEYLIPFFETVYDIANKKKWALCFDELEFAPLWLQQKLFTSLRSRSSQYILYKLSASPILPTALEQSLKSTYSASPGNDVQMIKMWSSSDNEDFSLKLIDSLVRKKDRSLKTETFFGTNDIYNKSPDSYQSGSVFFKQMTELIKKDDSFRDFLAKYHINITNPLPNNDNQKDTLFRKIKPIVYFRNYFIDENRKGKSGITKITYRSRKVNELYSGIEILKRVCDGNPRWLIGITNSILSKTTGRECDKKTQAAELLNGAERFSNVIANIPVGESQYTLLDILERTGNFFNDQVLGKRFQMDPKCSFTVNDSKFEIDNALVDLLEKGVSQGAFILLNSDSESFDFEIRNQRFKLSYLLSVKYKLPLRRYPAIKLSECLQPVPDEDDSQMSLFS
ncbi:hypothetical protein GWC95_15720 [Sediminibacterium roseum]|uniref:Uncharacterized protein n=1 Tax=Sediminibacterium roseum TaxID=1978412 RepID=A0ABW9ZW38_9BACT|nr:hypothetical protein [Sediminibacterium roseum]NCI51377.1 hypothetical protein [Sediminibacterium roseum]